MECKKSGSCGGSVVGKEEYLVEPLVELGWSGEPGSVKIAMV